MCSGNTKVLKLKMADFMLFFKHSRFVTDSDGSRKKVQNLEIHVIGTYYLVCGNMSTLNIDPEMLKLDIIRLSKRYKGVYNDKNLMKFLKIPYTTFFEYVKEIDEFIKRELM